MLYDLYFSNTLYITEDTVVIISSNLKQLPKFDLKIQVIRYLSIAEGGPGLMNTSEYSYSSWKR